MCNIFLLVSKFCGFLVEYLKVLFVIEIVLIYVLIIGGKERFYIGVINIYLFVFKNFFKMLFNFEIFICLLLVNVLLLFIFF